MLRTAPIDTAGWASALCELPIEQLRSTLEELLSLIVEQTGDATIRHAARYLDGMISRDCGEINDEDALDAVEELMAAGMSQAEAITAVCERLKPTDPDNFEHRIRRKLRERRTGRGVRPR